MPDCVYWNCSKPAEVTYKGVPVCGEHWRLAKFIEKITDAKYPE